MITIITPSFNRADMIETAIKSVVDQGYPHIEHIIIDGGSTDGTQDLLKNYPHLRVVSEPDQGMYDALNKGLELATGEIIGFLNTDDFYATGIFSQIARHFSEGGVDAVAGLAAIVQQPVEFSKDMVMLHPGQGEDLVRHTAMDLPIFNAYFFSKRVFQIIGNFDTRYKIGADRDFMLRYVLGSFNTTFLDRLVYYYLQHPGSMTFDFSEAKRRNTADELRLMAESYVVIHPECSRLLFKSLAEQRTFDTIRFCGRCLRNKDFYGAWSNLLEGFRYSPLWGIRFLKYMLFHFIH